MTLPERSHTDDAELVQRLKDGDLDALDAVYHRYANALLRLAYRLTGSEDEAEDLLQDVFVGLPLALRRYVDRGAFSSWLRAVMTHAALNRLRRSRRRREVKLERAAMDAQCARATDGALSDLIVKEALDALPVDLRAVFVLREIEGYSHSEIAEMLGIRRGTSEVRLFRAVRELRRLLRNSE